MAKYRFKTEEEFKRDGLWGTNKPQYWVNQMVPVLGQEIREDIKGLDLIENSRTKDFKDKFPEYGVENSWIFRGCDIVKIEEEPVRVLKSEWENYSPFDYILGVEMQNGNKYYLAPNCDGFVPVNLKSHMETGYSSINDLESGFNECSVLDGNKKVFKFDSMQEMIAWATS